jgi:hypothetical protein
MYVKTRTRNYILSGFLAILRSFNVILGYANTLKCQLHLKEILVDITTDFLIDDERSGKVIVENSTFWLMSPRSSSNFIYRIQLAYGLKRSKRRPIASSGIRYDVA